MDYADRAHLTRHDSWEAFLALERIAGSRLVLLTTRAEPCGRIFGLQARRLSRATDVLRAWRRESARRCPKPSRAAVDARLRVPLAPGMRSLNVVVAAAVVLGEALRQTEAFPGT